MRTFDLLHTKLAALTGILSLASSRITLIFTSFAGHAVAGDPIGIAETKITTALLLPILVWLVTSLSILRGDVVMTPAALIAKFPDTPPSASSLYWNSPRQQPTVAILVPSGLLSVNVVETEYSPGVELSTDLT
jgi:hypothetical protein